MMPKRPAHRRPRRRIFVGCEGKSEEGYAAVIQQLANDAGLSVYLDIRRYRGGDPLVILNKAVGEIRTRGGLYGNYDVKAIFLNADRRQEDLNQTSQAELQIRRHAICAIWSQPTLEALLLRHLPGCTQLRPPTGNLALQQIQRHWPEYRKGMAKVDLLKGIDRDGIGRAARVEPKLREFLVSIGLLA